MPAKHFFARRDVRGEWESGILKGRRPMWETSMACSSVTALDPKSEKVILRMMQRNVGGVSARDMAFQRNDVGGWWTHLCPLRYIRENLRTWCTQCCGRPRFDTRIMARGFRRPRMTLQTLLFKTKISSSYAYFWDE